MRLGLMARFWNAADLVAEWVDANLIPQVDRDLVLLMDCGSSDGTWDALATESNEHAFPLPFRLPPSAPMLSGLWCDMLLQEAKRRGATLLLALDHDEFLEPEFASLLPLLLSQPRATYWEFPRANHQFSRSEYSTASGDVRFRERILFRVNPSHYYPRNAVHHLERVPLGGPERHRGGPSLPPPNAELRGETYGLVLRHFSQRDAKRSRLWYERLRSGAGEDRPTIAANPEQTRRRLVAEGHLKTWRSYTDWLHDPSLDRGWGTSDRLAPGICQAIEQALGRKLPCT